MSFFGSIGCFSLYYIILYYIILYISREGGICCNLALVVPWLIFSVVFLGALCILPMYFVVLLLFNKLLLYLYI